MICNLITWFPPAIGKSLNIFWCLYGSQLVTCSPMCEAPRDDVSTWLGPLLLQTSLSELWPSLPRTQISTPALSVLLTWPDQTALSNQSHRWLYSPFCDGSFFCSKKLPGIITMMDGSLPPPPWPYSWIWEKEFLSGEEPVFGTPRPEF